ncbi:3112_t:CDS:1, partial [Ambispora leptoticha]
MTKELLEDSEIINMLQADNMIENDILNLNKENEEFLPPLISVME